jgi:hypothetical protein
MSMANRSPASITRVVGCAALVAACGAEPGDMGGDGDGSNDCRPSSCQPLPAWAFDGVFTPPNLDDDDGNGRADWNDPPFVGDDDLSTLVLPATVLRRVPEGGDIELALTGDVDGVRVFRAGELVLGRGAQTTHAVATDGSDLTFSVELHTYNTRVSLAVTARDAGGAVVETTTVALQASPLILNHHLQPAEHVWAVRVSSNANFIDAFEGALGASFTAVAGSSYRSDVWIQDEFEFGTLTGAAGQRIDVVVDSIRDRGIDPYAQDTLVDRQTIAPTWGSSQPTTYDSFGNLEASPPVTVNGVRYPFGRIYYGFNGTVGLNSELRAFLAAQQLQAPIELSTSWLCVGHVDEVVSFVPDPGSAKGFKMVFADVAVAYQLLDALPATASIGRYGNAHGYSTVGALRGDSNLRTLNTDLQRDRIDPMRTKLMTELGLDESDVIRIPALFERAWTCGGRVAALIPGMVNMTIAQVGGTTHLFTADPFFRASGTTQADDPIIAAFAQLMPAGMTLHFVDDWSTYHMSLGEVHCGSNVRRTPIQAWWETEGTSARVQPSLVAPSRVAASTAPAWAPSAKVRAGTAELATLQPSRTRAGHMRFSTEAVEDPRATAVLVDRLRSRLEPEEVRIALAEALPRTGGTYGDVLVELLSFESSPHVRAVLVHAASRISVTDARAVIRAAVADDDDEVRATAMRTAAARADGGTLGDVLATGLGDRAAVVRAEAARSIGIHRASAASATLAGLLGDTSTDVRFEALRALDGVAPALLRAHPALPALARDPDPRIARLATDIAARPATSRHRAP